MIVVVDYKAGNLYNVANALRHLNAEFKFSGDPQVVSEASKVVLPGVGSAKAAMDSLDEQGLCEVLRELKVPFLGICLGLQLLYELSEEDQTPCLGVIPGTVRKFNREKVKVPQIGWNQVQWDFEQELPRTASQLLCGVDGPAYYYFVHSYFAPVTAEWTFGKAEYETEFSAAVAKENFVGLQFHPERSGVTGLALLKNFVEL